eukprot:611456_1
MAEQKESDDHDVYVHMPGGDDNSATTMPCNPCVKYQARISAFLRPGHWIPCLRDCHAYSTAGCFKSESKTKGSEYVNAIRDAMEQCKLIVYQSKPTPYGFLIEAYDFTKCCGWLDIVILKVYWDDKTPLEVRIEAIAGATGVLPLLIPLAPLLNVVLCWVPFSDVGRSKKTLDNIFALLKF